MVFGHNITSISRNSAIYKFVVIRVLFYQLKVETGVEKQSERAAGNGVDYVVGDDFVCHTSDYLFIFA